LQSRLMNEKVEHCFKVHEERTTGLGQIGFIGIGMMGGPMACNLIKAGFELLVYDARPEVKSVKIFLIT